MKPRTMEKPLSYWALALRKTLDYSRLLLQECETMKDEHIRKQTSRPPKP